MKKLIIATIIALNVGSISLFAAASSARPNVVSKVMPSYPVSCVQAGVEGKVIVEGLVNAKGELLGANAVNNCDPALAEAAVQAVTQWKFTPAIQDGTPTDTVVRIPVQFKLEANSDGTFTPDVIARS